jgi:hypothetical protein
MFHQCIMILNSRTYAGIVSLVERIFLSCHLLHDGSWVTDTFLYWQMKRKHVGIRQVYDARALRVIVGDKDGALHGPAVRSCYSILDIVHRFVVNLIIYLEPPMSRKSRHAKSLLLDQINALFHVSCSTILFLPHIWLFFIMDVLCG